MDPKCPLSKHQTEYHHQDVSQARFKMEPLKRCQWNIARLLTESQMTDKTEDQTLMNSKAEYGRNKMVRYQPTVQRV